MNTKTAISIALATVSLLAEAQADITTALDAFWTFNDGPGSQTAADDSGNGNLGTLTNFADTTYTSMWTNNTNPTNGLAYAMLFNTNGATSNYVSVPDAAGLDFASVRAWTLAAWVYLSVPGASQVNGACIMSKGAGGYDQYSLDISNGFFRSLTRNAGGGSQQIASSTFKPAAGVWYHLVATWNRAQTIDGVSGEQQILYIDGTNNASFSSGSFLTTSYVTNHPLTIGNKQSSYNSAYNLPFQGIIENAEIFARPLAAADAMELYTNSSYEVYTPNIATQPRGVSCFVGDSPIFTVAANTNNPLPNLKYQWQLNGTNLAGATNTALQFANVQLTNAGTYTVIVTNYFGSALSSNAVLGVQSLPPPNTTNGLVGWWKFDDASGSSTAADSSGNGNTGTLAGFTDTTYTSMWTNGVFSGTGALAFNGDGTGADLVAVPNVGVPAPPILDFSGNPTFSLAAWVHGALVQSNEAAIVAKGAGGGGEQYVLEVTNSHYLFYVIDTNQVEWTAQTAVAPDAGWQHLAAVLNASNGVMTCYVNGQLAASVVAPFSVQTNSNEVSIGNRQPPGSGNYGDPLTGFLDDVRIYDRALTSADVEALYQSAVVAPAVNSSSPPAPNGNPINLFAGVNMNFSLAASGTAPLSYQWFTNGVAVAGATATNLSLASLPAGRLTNACVISNSLGKTTNVWVINAVSPSATPYWAAVFHDHPVNFWPLDEVPDNTNGDDGLPAYDYIAANDGFYTNAVLGQTGYGEGLAAEYSYTMATDTNSAAEFGSFSSPNSYVGINGIKLAAPSGSNAEFSVEAWAAFNSDADGGIVAKGFGGGGEEFAIYPGGTGNSLIFLVRSAVAAPSTTTGSVVPNQGSGVWYHLVGVCDEANSNISLYVNGVLSGSASILPQSGIISDDAIPMSIGARTSERTSSYNDQTFGYINDVAFYNYALSPAQIADHYYAAGIGATILTTLPDQTNVNEGATLTISAAAGGTPALAYQWYDVTSGPPGAAISGQTSATLTISDVSSNADNDHLLELTVTNLYGQATSSEVEILVQPASSPVPIPVTIQTSGNMIVINWPSGGANAGFLLQKNSDLSTTNWVTDTNAVNLVNNQYQVTEPATNTDEYYRLEWPASP